MTELPFLERNRYRDTCGHKRRFYISVSIFKRAISALFLSQLLLGCSPKNTTNSVRLSTHDLGTKLDLPEDSISSNDSIYFFIDSGGKRVFFTSLYECGADIVNYRRKSGDVSLARQLLVGLDNLRIIQRHRVSGEPSVLRVISTAKLENQFVRLTSYSGMIEHCVVDTIFWSLEDKTPLTDHDAIQALENESKRFERVALLALQQVALQSKREES